MGQMAGSATSKRIGRFPVKGILGRGGQGIVYLGVDPTLKRKVAIKTLLPVPGADSDFDKQALLDEALTVSKLQHPNIVSVFEAGQLSGKPYLVYEYVDGQTLAKILKDEGEMPILDGLRLIIQLLDGIHYAHTQKVTHYDLKPSNLMIQSDGKLRIMDFGLSGILGSEVSSTQEVWGSPQYMAPENFSADPVGPWSDIYSIGIILYEMLTGKPVFQSNDSMSLLYKISHLEILPPSRKNSGIDGKLDDIILKSLSKNSKKRYGNAGEMQGSISKYLRTLESFSKRGDAPKGESSTLDFLIRRMKHKSDFPATSYNISEINKMAATRSEATASGLANIILRDYSLTTKILKLVNSSFYGQYGGKISTVSRAVVILGFEQIRMIALGLILFDHLQNDSKTNDLKEEAISSLMGGLLAKNIAEGIPMIESEEAFVCSMFHNLGRLLVIYYFGEEFELVKIAQSKKGLDENAAAKSILGLSFEEIGIGIAKYWHFPTRILHSMQGYQSAKVGRPLSKEDNLRAVSGFSNAICEAIMKADPENRESALTSVMDKFKNGVPVSEESIPELMSKVLVDVENQADVFKVEKTSSPFMSKLTQWTRANLGDDEDESEVDASDALIQADTSDEAVGKQDSQSVLLNGIQDITNAILEGTAINDILVMVIETMYRGFGFNRVMLCIIDPRAHLVSARFGFGKDIDEIMPRFKFKLIKEANDPFHKAVFTGKDIAVDDLFDQKNAGVMPDWYKKLVSAQAAVVYPIMINKKAMGFLYGDREEESSAINDGQKSSLGTLRNQAILAIKQNA